MYVDVLVSPRPLRSFFGVPHENKSEFLRSSTREQEVVGRLKHRRTHFFTHLWISHTDVAFNTNRAFWRSPVVIDYKATLFRTVIDPPFSTEPVRRALTAKGSHDSGVCQRDGQQPSLFGARNIRPVNSAAATTYVSLTGARSSANMAGRAVRKRPAAEIWPPEPKCVGRIRVGLTCSRGVARVPASQVAVVWCLGVRSRLP